MKKELYYTILQALGEMDVLNPNPYGYEELAEFLCEKINTKHVTPPIVFLYEEKIKEQQKTIEDLQEKIVFLTKKC